MTYNVFWWDVKPCSIYLWAEWEKQVKEFWTLVVLLSTVLCVRYILCVMIH